MSRPDSKNGMFLTRLPFKRDPRIRIQFATDIPHVEFIPFDQIAWVEPYEGEDGTCNNSRVLLHTLEFRCYLQSMEDIKSKVCEFVGRNAREGKGSPEFPWVIAQS